MEEIFKQYGGPIITVLVIICLLAIMTLLLQTNGPVRDLFQKLMNQFFDLANLNRLKQDVNAGAPTGP